MTEDRRTMTENDFLAYVDGTLGESAREEMRRHLSDHPDDARMVETWRRQNAALQALYGPVSDEAVPPGLDVRRIGRTVRSRRAPWLAFAAAAVVILALGVTGGWLGRSLLGSSAAPSDPLLAEAAQAHRLYASDVMHPVEVRAEDATHLRTWLSKRLDRPLNIPDLKAYGLSLVGGRLLPNADGAAAQFMYEDETGRRVTLYIVPARDAPETAILRAGIGTLEALFWNDETIRCALIGDLAPERMRMVADATYRQLS